MSDDQLRLDDLPQPEREETVAPEAKRQMDSPQNASDSADEESAEADD